MKNGRLSTSGRPFIIGERDISGTCSLGRINNAEERGCIILSMLKKQPRGIWIVPAVLAVTLGIYFLPPVHDRLSWRVDDLRTQVKYALNPPDQAIFLPTQQAAIDAIVNATMHAHATAAAATQTPRATTTRVGPTAKPTFTPTPLPLTVKLSGVKYVDQRDRWNYCAPANLTMALNFWGWQGNRDDVAKVVKPGENDPSKTFIDRGFTDKNVMPYEMVDFVNGDTEYRALYRYGGDVPLIKTMLAGGFPIVAEKGYYEADYKGKVAWLGHYQFVTGYDEASEELIVQDTWNDGPNFRIPYDTFMEGWRSFNFAFIVVYPADREQQALRLLGPYADARSAAGKALERADSEVMHLRGIDLLFAWFAKGTSHVALQQYVDAASAYDQAFSLYASLTEENNERPFRMMWYQTGPYWAYFYSGRYADVINLANNTFKTASAPTLEESLYWRGLAEYALGDTAAGISDVRKSVYYNMNFAAGIAKLQEWGVGQ
jgi:tetratricopeptide (TPR) repeat protein